MERERTYLNEFVQIQQAPVTPANIWLSPIIPNTSVILSSSTVSPGLEVVFSLNTGNTD